LRSRLFVTVFGDQVGQFLGLLLDELLVGRLLPLRFFPGELFPFFGDLLGLHLGAFIGIALTHVFHRIAVDQARVGRFRQVDLKGAKSLHVLATSLFNLCSLSFNRFSLIGQGFGPLGQERIPLPFPFSDNPLRFGWKALEKRLVFLGPTVRRFNGLRLRILVGFSLFGSLLGLGVFHLSLFRFPGIF